MPSLPPSQEPARPLTVRLMTGWMALKFAKLNVTLPILLFFGACQVPSRPRGLPLHCVSSMICSHGNAPSVQTTFAVATTAPEIEANAAHPPRPPARRITRRIPKT